MNPRVINRIAKTELATLFYSPIAWLLLVVFAVHVGVDFGNILGEVVRIKATRGSFSFSATAGIVLGHMGLYEVIQNSIYLYIPLLTMNLMSREYSSGSDKLLFSSPVSNLDIILGKYVSMLVCSLIFTLILALPMVVVCICAPHPDLGLIASALLAMFFLISTYCAIGLLMSSLTQYQVVAVVSTLAVLAFFNYVGEIGQSSPAFREITYWLSIKGRASEMLSGLINSDDVIYFISVSVFCLALAVIRLNNQKSSRSKAAKAGRYVTAVALLLLVAFVSSRPGMRLFYDATQNKARTLSEASQEVMKQLDGPMTITTYVDVQDGEFASYIPSRQLADRERFQLYIRFKPEIKMKYVYYYSPITDTSVLNKYPGLDEEQIAKEIAISKGWRKPVLCSAESLKDEIDLAEEKYRFVRVIERGNGAQARLRLYNDLLHHPGENEISAAMKKMIADPVKIGAVTGHGERSARRSGDRDYSIFASDGQFRHSMVNQGFDLVELDLAKDSIPSDVNILMISDTRMEIPEAEMRLLEGFLDRGGNLMLVTDVKREPYVEELLSYLGLKAGAESPVDEKIYDQGTSEAADLLGGFYKTMQKNPSRNVVAMEGAVALEPEDSLTFKKTPLLVSDTSKVCAYALSREVEAAREGQQRVIVVGDADCYSNSALQTASLERGRNIYNFSMLSNSFKWLCYNEFPVSSPRPPIRDNDFSLSPKELYPVKRIYTILIPLLIALTGFCIIRKRNRR